MKKLRISKNKNYMISETDKNGFTKINYGCVGGSVVRDIIGKAVCTACDEYLNEYIFVGYDKWFSVTECKNISVSVPSVW